MLLNLNQKTIYLLALVLLVTICLGVVSAEATTFYVDATGGNDTNDGQTEATAFQTLDKVNSYPLVPSDEVLFKRGEIFRGQLVPQSGDAGVDITYGAYGTGAKPLLLGSKELNQSTDWIDAGNNIWVSRSAFDGALTSGNELLSNPSFDTDTSGWSLHDENGAEANASRDMVEYDSSPAGYIVDCVSSGTSSNHIQLYTTGISITEDKCYKLTFRAKATERFQITAIRLMKTSSPWNTYYSEEHGISPTISTNWKTYEVLYKTNITASDGRITFYLGDNLPSSAIFYIDSLNFEECVDDALFAEVLSVDVGNIIFNDEDFCGIKVWEEVDLDTLGDYWYDEDYDIVKTYSSTNPATYYSDIECAFRRHIISINNTSYVTIVNLALKYGAAHGIGGSNTSYITIRDCDISYIGGGDQFGGTQTVRYGNGIEFWENAHDNLVERCRLWEIYDAALTNQGNRTNSQYNIIYHNNLIWNCEYSFEYWNRDETSTTDNIFFENNTCVNAGYGWGHGQRPDPSGRHLCFYFNSAITDNIYIRNNIFLESKTTGYYLHNASWTGLENVVLDYNCWYQASGPLMQYQGTEYTMSEFSTYQTETGKDAHSKTQNPLLSDVNNANFHLTINSPAIDAGVSVGITHDFDLNSIPLGDAPDIGAFEYNSCLAPFPAGQLRREFKVSGTFYDDIGGHHRTYLFAAIMSVRDYCLGDGTIRYWFFV